MIMLLVSAAKLIVVRANCYCLVADICRFCWLLYVHITMVVLSIYMC